MAAAVRTLSKGVKILCQHCNRLVSTSTWYEHRIDINVEESNSNVHVESLSAEQLQNLMSLQPDDDIEDTDVDDEDSESDVPLPTTNDCETLGNEELMKNLTSALQEHLGEYQSSC
jgi:hypothetical protein